MMSQGHWVVIANPSSGKGRNQIVRDRALEELKTRVRTVDLIDLDDLQLAMERFASTLSTVKQIDGVLVIGGDGTIHHVVRTMTQAARDIPVALIPNGSGNDFARQMGLYRKTPSDLIEFFTSDDPTMIDILEVEEQAALQVISTGFDAVVSARARRMPRFLGTTRYVLALCLQLATLSATRYHLTVNGVQREVDATLVAIANGRNYGGGMLISPHSDNGDGVFEVVIVGPLSRLRLVLLFPRIFTGSHIKHELVEIIQTSDLRIEADTIAEADGEAMFLAPINLRISRRSFRTWRMA